MENSRTLPDGIVHFRNFDTQAPRWGLHSWVSKKKRPAIAQPHQGTEHGASSRVGTLRGSPLCLSPLVRPSVVYAYLDNSEGANFPALAIAVFLLLVGPLRFTPPLPP